MENNLIITVSGKLMSGKSRIIYLLEKLLKEEGFNVDVELGPDYHSRSHFDRLMTKNLNESIQTLKEKSSIIIKEQQLPRI